MSTTIPLPPSIPVPPIEVLAARADRTLLGWNTDPDASTVIATGLTPGAAQALFEQHRNSPQAFKHYTEQS